MSFAFLSIWSVLGGIAALAVALWFAQRLRVQHREVEVLSTLFWQAALKETRARVFVRRFRHWPAWLLLLAITSLLWMLAAKPRWESPQPTQHVVLVDWSTRDVDLRRADLKTALQYSAGLPESSREIIAAGNQLVSLVTPGEDLELAELRTASLQDLGASSTNWAIHSLANRASSQQPMRIYLIGNASLDEASLQQLPDHVQLFRIGSPSEAEPPSRLLHLGFADAMDGPWNSVDVEFALPEGTNIRGESLRAEVNGLAGALPIEQLAEHHYRVPNVLANGGIFQLLLLEQNRPEELIGSLTLPVRKKLLIQLEPGVPSPLQDLVALDESLQVVEQSADLKIGFAADCDLRLIAQTGAAFQIQHASPQMLLADIVDDLALKQIDATSLAEASNRVIEVELYAGERRQIALWEDLLTPAFDFTNSRAFPIFIAEAIRWLAEQPPEVPWAEQGARLPWASSEFERADAAVVSTSDGRPIHTSLLAHPIASGPLLETRALGLLSRFTPFTWFGALACLLLLGEWVLYQRGRMP